MLALLTIILGKYCNMHLPALPLNGVRGDTCIQFGAAKLKLVIISPSTC